MTPLLVTLLGLLGLYGLYIAARVARLGRPAAEFLDGGGALPGWAVMVLLPGLVLAGAGIGRHLELVGRFGLQASHVGMGAVLVALAALAVWSRVWLATRIAGLATPGEALGRYYDSVALRIVMMGLALIFALPFAADHLGVAAGLLDAATGGAIPRAAGVWLIAVALAVPAIVGGWRAIVLALALYAVLIAVLLPGLAAYTEIVLPGPGFPATPIAVADGILWDSIPGVIQNSFGIGKSVPSGGIFSAVGIGSSAVALLGLVLSPAALYLGQTTRAGSAFGVSAVWLTAGLAAAMLLVAVPALALRIDGDLQGLAETLFAVEPLVGAALVLLPIAGSLTAIAFFVTGGTILFTRELVHTFLLPGLDDAGRRFSVRVALGFGFFLVALLAGFAPLLSAVLASVALPLSVQMLPAILGLAYLRWIGRGAVLAGMILGMLIVLFTEPPGLILFEGLFIELPWGRWPLTIHSAVWGLAFNLLFVGLSAAATLKTPDRFERARLHEAMGAHVGRPAEGRRLLWAFTVLWGFLAMGPGAILGNFFFSHPVFSPVEAALGIPSLWAWQLLFWLVGVVIVWWLAYRVGLGRTSAMGLKPIILGPLAERRTPDWLAAGLARVVARTPRSPRRDGRGAGTGTGQGDRQTDRPARLR